MVEHQFNMINLMFIGSIILLAKLMTILFVFKTITIRRTRLIVLPLIILLSPTLVTIWLCFEITMLDNCAMLPITFLGLVFDIGALQWVRAIFEPPETTADLDYPDHRDLTNF